MISSVSPAQDREDDIFYFILFCCSVRTEEARLGTKQGHLLAREQWPRPQIGVEPFCHPLKPPGVDGDRSEAVPMRCAANTNRKWICQFAAWSNVLVRAEGASSPWFPHQKDYIWASWMTDDNATTLHSISSTANTEPLERARELGALEET
jgi:hypothetical protein